MGLFDFFKKKPAAPKVVVEVLYPQTWENGEAPVEPTVLAAEVLQPTPGEAVEIQVPSHIAAEEVAPVAEVVETVETETETETETRIII